MQGRFLTALKKHSLGATIDDLWYLSCEDNSGREINGLEGPAHLLPQRDPEVGGVHVPEIPRGLEKLNRNKLLK